jgi:hypothetical protein
VAEGDIELSAVSTEPGDETGQELLRIFPQADPEAEAFNQACSDGTPVT